MLWAQSLLEKRQALEHEKQAANQANSGVKITQLDCDSDNDDEKCVEGLSQGVESRIDVYKHRHNHVESHSDTVIGKLPSNYVQMRDYLPP